MKRKFKIGDLVCWEDNPEEQYKIIDFTNDSEKLVKGDWFDGSKEWLILPNYYIFKKLEDNKLYWNPIEWTDKHYELIQAVKEEPLPPLEWNGLKEIFI